MIAEADPKRVSPFISKSERQKFQKYKYPAYYLWVVLHELLGHGTGKMMIQKDENTFNFDINNPPIDPITCKPITSWYKPGETWTGQFGDLATTVDECRAELVGAYLMDDRELLALFGFTDETELTANDSKHCLIVIVGLSLISIVTYNTYMQLGTDGIRGLANFNIEHSVSQKTNCE